MSSNEYFLAWLVYASASFFVIMFWFWMTSPLSSLTVRLLLRFPVMAVLLTPIPHVLDTSLYVPAVAAFAFDIIGNDSMALSSDMMVIISAILASLLAALVLGFTARLLGRLLSTGQDSKKAPQPRKSPVMPRNG